MLSLALLLNLVLFAAVVSQHLFYAVALGGASRALSAPAYVELRNAINALMKRRVPVLYLATLATSVVVLWASLAARDGLLILTSAVGLAALVGDAALIARENVPINSVIETWTPTSHPADWATYRDRWLAIFAVRQALACTGFVALLAGAAFR